MYQQPARSTIDLSALEEHHETARNETFKALEILSNARRHALTRLQKTQIMFKYLNWKQQEHIEDLCGGNFSLQKMYSLSAFPLGGSGFTDNPAVPVSLERSASYLQRTETARKNIVQFGIIQARTDELIKAITKAVGVFNYQYRKACRELFPLGFFSKVWRSIKRFFNRPYFSWQELGCLANLGATAGFVLKMAEVPVFGVRR